MSHEGIMAGLKKLIKQDLLGVDPSEHVHHILKESDRTAIILCASVIEDMIQRQLEMRMPGLNADERDRIFHFEGPCGSFSSRIRMAQALGILDRPMRKRIELIKEMRNAAAHSHLPIQFDTPAIHSAIAGLFEPSARTEIMSWNSDRLRAAFSTFCIALGNSLAGNEPLDVSQYFEWVRNQGVRPRP